MRETERGRHRHSEGKRVNLKEGTEKQTTRETDIERQTKREKVKKKETETQRGRMR